MMIFINPNCRFSAVIAGVILSASVRAQEIQIPDPGLNAAIREALQIPAAPLTAQNLLTLTNLNASNRNITNISGLEAARSLVSLDLRSNSLTTLALPPDLTQLTSIALSGNPLINFVLPQPLAATSLADDIAQLRDQGVSIFPYPLMPEIVQPRQLIGAFHFGILGPPGAYTVFGSTNLILWNPVGDTTNSLGAIISFTDVTANLSIQKFYQLRLQTPPTNMVFVPSNTFVMGSPASELHRDANEGPQTTVTLSAFWIGKYEVTQAEYLSVTGTNPSPFSGDLSFPISSVSWPDATNYCALLTQRERAAGRISATTEYRLPTEAEWECAARAGTTTRFSYGDDPDYSSLANYAWQNFENGLTVHPVGQKLPNPWGLYDMAGNVFEWCQDWLGPLPGGSVTDPKGAPSNDIGWKIMRGGAFDVGGSACRSASRSFYGNHPALNDWNLGFRVVLAGK